MSTLPIDTRAADSLLQNCIHGNGDFFALAAQHGLSLDQLIAWFQSHATQRRIRDLQAIADARTALLVRLNRAAAVTRLSQVLTNPHATVHESVRAAAAILRTARDVERREAEDRTAEPRSTNQQPEAPAKATIERSTNRAPTGMSRALPASRPPAIGRHSLPYALADSDSAPAPTGHHHDPILVTGAAERATPDPLPPQFKHAAHAPVFHLGAPHRAEVATASDFTRAGAVTAGQSSRRPSSPNLGPPVFAGA